MASPTTFLSKSCSIHKIVLDDLGVRQIAAVVGGSMGGMLVLEYAYFGPEYVRTIVPIATSSRHSAWCISWGETQRQSIYCDPKYQDGYYSFDDPPSSGLGAARMAALLTYRSRDSFEARFGRNTPDPSKLKSNQNTQLTLSSVNEHWQIHNEGHKITSSPRRVNGRENTPPATPMSPEVASLKYSVKPQFTDPQFHGSTVLLPPSPPTLLPERRRATTYFSAQSYLRYQGEKFVGRFDSNCYIACTRKLDTHDVSRHRVPVDTPNAVKVALSQIKQPALVIGIESDGLFTFAEQQEIAESIPNSRLRTIESPEGHDAFLLQFEQVNRHIMEFFNEVLTNIMNAPQLGEAENTGPIGGDASIGKIEKSSVFGEAEIDDDLTAW